MKKRPTNNISKYLLAAIIILLLGCNRTDDWLDKKRSLADVTPKTLPELQGILDYNAWVNNRMSAAGQLATDNYFLTDANYLATTQQQRNLYTFQKDIWAGGTSPDWTYQYSLMEYANIVLDGLGSLNSSQPGFNNLKGEALFFRALALYTLSQVFCKPYIANSANVDMGIPVRVTSDVNVTYSRGTLQQTYQQMVEDATNSIDLLDQQPLQIRRPSKAAAMALLAKIYLVMDDYTNALLYSDKALALSSTLIDFNNTSIVSPTSTYRFPADGTNNPEIIFFASQSNYSALSVGTGSKASVDMTFYNLYNTNDLRKSIFYSVTSGLVKYTGVYTGNSTTFCGIATNELYLIRAECYARQNSSTLALKDLNTLLIKRYKAGTFVPVTVSDPTTLLTLILQERRKELPFTAEARWEDLRRLNKDSRFQVTVNHIVNGTTYTLVPNSNAYVLPIPDGEIQTSGIAQNIR